MYRLGLEPVVPLTIILLLMVVPVLLIVTGICMRRRASWLRGATVASFAAALLNPVLIWQEREHTQATLALIVDRSQSQKIVNRTQQSDSALAWLKTVLAQFPQFDVRIIEVAGANETEGGSATHLFSQLQQAFADVQPARQGGVIMITDGQVHDIPDSWQDLGLESPLNVLITGHEDEYDRQIRLVAAPRFGLVGHPVELAFIVDDTGKRQNVSDPVDVTLLINGIEIAMQKAVIGVQEKFEFVLPLAGNNIIELTTPVVEEELTTVNNRAALMIDGVRENLKTLLVSGEPHNGLRLWRDLLKSDAGVDLVHFTILRPPEKSDNTPTSELSLISFPTTELFVDKIDEFDLIIFDRYQHYDILPLIYYDYIAEYVKKGGALLFAAGPEYANENVSLALTPLVSVLPATPTGAVIQRPFLPQLTDEGKKHPVTRDLEGAQMEPPTWGRWLRQIDVDRIDEGTRVLLSGVDDRALMLLGKKGEGRVGMLLSDQGWLWARGFEGGGPYAGLYRRMAYWLLKQPELEEEALLASTQADHITIERQTMLDINAIEKQKNLDIARITLPSGKIVEQRLIHDRAGWLTGSFSSDEVGLFRVENGDKVTFALIGSLDAPEFVDVVSTPARFESLTHASGGNVIRLGAREKADMVLPPVQIAREGDRLPSGRIILRESRDSHLLRMSTVPLYSAFFALFLTLLLLGTTWYREAH